MKILACVLCCSVLLSAQADGADPKKALARAIVIEDEEKDLAQAERLYRELAASSPDAGVKEDALRRLQRLQEKLAQTQPLAHEDTLRTQRALVKLRADDENSWKNARQDLLYVGSGAVPELRRQLLEERRDRLFLVRGVEALAGIGGESASSAIKEVVERGEPFTRRAALEGVRSAASDSEPVRKVLPVFTSVPELETRLQAIAELGSMLLPGDLLALADTTAGASAAAVRAASFAVIRQRWTGLNADDPLFPRLADVLGKALDRPDPDAVRTVLGVGHGNAAEWQRVLLRALGEAVPDDHIGLSRYGPIRRELLPELVATARKVAASGKPDWRQTVLANLATASAVGWTDADIAAAIELFALGLGARADGNGIEAWIVRHAKPEHVVPIAEAMQAAWASSTLLSWLRERDQLPKALFAPLRALHTKKGWANDSDGIGALIARLGTPEAIDYLRGLSKPEPAAAGQAAYLLVVASRPPVDPAAEAALCEFLLAKFEGQEPENMRAMVWGRLMQIGAKNAIELYAKALRLGVGAWSPLRFGARSINWDGPQLRGLQWLYKPDGNEKAHGYGDADVMRIFDLCLTDPASTGWQQIDDLPDALAALPVGVTEVLCKHALATPEEFRRNFVPSLLARVYQDGAPRTEAVFELMDRVLRGDDWNLRSEVGRVVANAGAFPPRAQALLRRMVEDGATVESALARLETLDAKDMAPRILKLLKSEVVMVRHAAARALARQLGRDAVPEIVPLLADKETWVRQAIAELAGQMADRRFVPGLLALLRDPEQGVRKAATEALEKLQFIEQQQAFWERLAKDSGLSAPSAAEALVKQAGKEQSKAIRLVALDSLGTLGVPETLPFLIQWMQDPDAEIAARAAAAVQRINTAKR